MKDGREVTAAKEEESGGMGKSIYGGAGHGRSRVAADDDRSALGPRSVRGATDEKKECEPRDDGRRTNRRVEEVEDEESQIDDGEGEGERAVRRRTRGRRRSRRRAARTNPPSGEDG